MDVWRCGDGVWGVVVGVEEGVVEGEGKGA